MKSSVEEHLLAALLDLERDVQRMATARTKPDLPAHFARIDRLAAQLPPDADPTLQHYLRKRSYEKARRFLQGREAENQVGHCRHV